VAKRRRTPGFSITSVPNSPPTVAANASAPAAFDPFLVPAADAFRPDLVLVSAGFDWHRNDLGGNVTENGFAMMTRIVQGIAEKHCEGRLAFVLEGGYDLDSLADGAHAVLTTLAGQDPAPLVECGIPEVEEAIEGLREGDRRNALLMLAGADGALRFVTIRID